MVDRKMHCPRCGNRNVGLELVKSFPSGSDVYFVCPNCGLTAEASDTFQGAVEAWNRMSEKWISDLDQSSTRAAEGGCFTSTSGTHALSDRTSG